MQDNSLDNEFLIQAHKFCTGNKVSIEQGKSCGCFYCLNIFPANEVIDYIEPEDTAICPYCGIDSVICDKDINFDKAFLTKMKSYWF
jgi:hypothetical protein